jgi:two-component system C4-dicarboxylate transport response regulator DctD
MKTSAAQNEMPVPELPNETLANIMRYGWPGNIRELRHAIERMVITSQKGIAGPFIQEDNAETSRLLSLPATSGRLRDEMEMTEKRVIEIALRENGGEINATSQTLGISRRALYERMKKYGFDKDDFRT